MSELAIPLATLPRVVNFVRGAVGVAAAAAVAPEAAAIGGSILLVAGAYVAVGAAYHYFSQQNLKSIQDKALEKHLKGKFESGLYNVKIRGRGVFGEFFEDTIPKYGGYFASGVNADQYLKHFNSSASAPDHMKNEPVMKVISDGKILPHHNDANWFYGALEPITILSQELATTWDKLTNEERRAAINNLSDDEWNDIIKSMPQGGTIQSGQTLDNDVMTVEDARVHASGTKILTAEQQAIREAIKPELDTIANDLAKNGAAIAALSAAIGLTAGTVGNIDKNVANLGNVATQTKTSVETMQKNMNENFNKIRTRLKGIAGFLNFDRILNVLIWINTLHNAYMLSADLGRSLLSMVSTTLKALPGNSLLGLPTEAEDGSPLDLATTINKSIEKWIIGAIGAKNYKLMALELAQINRIYQSVGNLSSETSSILDSFRGPIAAGVERISQVGNALRRNGVVRDDSYPAMNEKVTIRSKGLSRLDRATDRLEALNNAVSVVESIASSVISIQEEVAEIKKYRKEYEDEKSKLVKEMEKKETDSKKASAAPDIKEEDEERYAPKKL